MKVEYEDHVWKLELKTGAKVIINEAIETVIISVPIRRIGHDHDDVVDIKVHKLQGLTDERTVFTKLDVPRVKISDPRFVEVVGYEPVVENSQSSKR